MRSLYQVDVGKCSFQEAVLDASRNGGLTKEMFYFCERLVRGYEDNAETIDDWIERYLRDWSFDRIAATDRNVLRIAVLEILFDDEMPPAVTIDEAVDIAKKYGTPESGKFVNGVLGNLLMDTRKADWVAPEGSDYREERPETEPEPEEVEVTPEQAEEAKKSFWKIRSENPA